VAITGLKALQSEDFRKQQELGEKLTKLFASLDFEPIEIPTIVDMSVVEKANSKFSADVFKLMDKDGTVLALRTELTQPIAKLVAQRFDRINLPQKFFYNSKVYRFSGFATDAAREIQQIGVEAFGEEVSDLEIADLMLKSIAISGLKKFKLTITHAAIWHQIFKLYGNPDMDFSTELDYLMQSNYFKSKIKQDNKWSLAAKAYKFLLDGDLIALEKNCKEIFLLLHSTDIKQIEETLGIDLSELKAILALDPNVVFDALQCPDLKLYTGFHMNLYAQGSGRLIALGGRYDKLCSQFGKDIPAIGFAFYVPGLLAALKHTDEEKTLRIALSKGTLLDGAIEFLKTKKIEVDLSNKRKLISQSTGETYGFQKIEILLVRGHDVPIYVQHGAADLGVVGLDTIIDSKANVSHLKDLGYGACTLSVCAPKNKYQSVADLPEYTKVSTTFPVITKDFFASTTTVVEIINLYGSVELGPLTGLSDVIVDLVASGKTLEENGLEVVEKILDCTARLICNNASYKLYKSNINKVLY
jgi:ATP phosphoribosyltransferase regulatory subunit